MLLTNGTAKKTSPITGSTSTNVQSSPTIFSIYPQTSTINELRVSSTISKVEKSSGTQIQNILTIPTKTATAAIANVESSITPYRSNLLAPSTKKKKEIIPPPVVPTKTKVVSHTRPSATPTPSFSPTPLSDTVTASSTAIGMNFILTQTPTNTPSKTPTSTPTITATFTSTPTYTPTQSITWPQISLTTYKSGFSNPVDIINANDGSNRLFIVERCGTIKIIDQNGNTLGTNFLNITARVNCSSSERGLLSAVFPPNYSSKNYFYVFYIQASGALTVSRFHVPVGTPNQANANSEEVLLTIPHADNTNHNGGKLAFGNDGYLYFSVGDGGGSGDTSNNAQNKNVLLGKLLRIDVESGAPTYAIPSTNPFASGGGLPEIWALGLRNPWRYSFDRLTHDLYIGDVGQDAWEEVDFQQASDTGGNNYGWRLREGNHCYNPSSGCGSPANYSAPVTEYSHDFGCAITGGYVYRGSEYAGMQGIYFYADYCSGNIWGLQRDNGNWYNQLLLDTTYNISTFGEDEAGNIYLTDLGSGTIYKIDSTNPPSIAMCPIFPANNIWNTRVDSLPVHARSSQWINSIGSNTSFHMDFGSGTWNGGLIGIPYNIVAGSSTTKYAVNFYYPDESDAGPYPIPSSPNMEFGSDHHILVVDTETCTLYETYDMSYSGGIWSGGSGAIWNLNSNTLRPNTWTSADAAGLPILPGLVRYEEVASGHINHALRFTAQSTNSFIWPARHLTSGTEGTLTSTPPLGARFRLKASYNISGFSPEMQVILRAMQEYGIILADNGSDWYVSGAPSESWNNTLLHTLDVLKGSDFEAVKTSSLKVDSNSGQAAP